MANIFRVSHILQIIAKYEKRRKYLAILHDKPCGNCFIVILSLYFVIGALSVGDSKKIRIPSERGKSLIT